MVETSLKKYARYFITFALPLALLVSQKAICQESELQSELEQFDDIDNELDSMNADNSQKSEPETSAERSPSATDDDELDLEDSSQSAEAAPSVKKENAPNEGDSNEGDSNEGDNVEDELVLVDPEEESKQGQEQPSGPENEQNAEMELQSDDLKSMETTSEEESSGSQKQSVQQSEPPTVQPSETQEFSDEAESANVGLDDSNPAQEGPDSDFEERLARIYKTFYSRKTSDEEWTQIVGPRANEHYLVQSGDTLWGISQTFFGNGFFWPKLWQLNSEFTNPHILELGDNIQFSPGSITSEPTLTLAPKANKLAEPESPRAAVTPEQSKAYLSNIQMPPALPHRPVINAPPSLPEQKSSEGDYDKSGFSIHAVKRFEISDMSFLNASILERPPQSHGEVVETETGASQVNLYQEAVLELDSAKEGDRYYAYKVGEKIVNEYGRGFPIEYQGEFEVLENIGKGRYRAICLDTITPINVGSLLNKGKLPQANFGNKGIPGNAKGVVFGGQYDNERRGMGLGNLIYITAGAHNGVKAGQLLSILKNYKLRNPDTFMREPVEPIGLIKIVNTSETMATGVVLQSREDIRSGDVLGSSELF